MPENLPITAAFVSCSGLVLTDTEKQLLEQMNPVGIVLFGRNIQSKQQVKALTRQIKDAVGRENLLIAVDQEGGRVRRLNGTDFFATTHNITLGNLPPLQAGQAAVLQARLTAADLLDCGINMNLAPVLDCQYENTSQALAGRCFSSDEKIVEQLGKAMVDEYIERGICPCIKHLPGHGRAQTDPHLHLPVINASLKELEKDFFPFKKLSKTPAGLTAHIILEAVDANHPVTQSSKAIKEIIRQAIGFDGLLISDALDMHALKGSLTEKTEASLAAGCDCIMYAMGQADDLKILQKKCPPLTDNALNRLYKIHKIISSHTFFKNLETDVAEYQKIVGSVAPYQDCYDATETLNLLQQKRSTSSC